MGWLLIAVGVLGLVALFAYKQLPQYLADRVHASVQSASVRLTLPKIDLGDPLGALSKTVVVDVQLRVENQSFLSLTVDHLSYDVRVQGRPVAKGEAALGEGRVLPSDGQMTVALETALDLTSIGIAGVGVLTDGKLELEALGTVEAGWGPIRIRRQYRVEGFPLQVIRPKLF